MKTKFNKIFGLGAALALASSLMSSCVSESPFGNGEGQLLMKMMISSELKTRAVENEQNLRETVQLRIYGEDGLIRSFSGIDEIPSDGIALKYGAYVAKAWAGDSVPASFTSKYYKTEEAFNINAARTTLTLKCNIANAVVKISSDVEDIAEKLGDDYEITVSSSTGSLSFNKFDETISLNGFFMMPYANGKPEDKLTVNVHGVKQDTKEDYNFSRTIEGVQSAHLYDIALQFQGASSSDWGGGFLSIMVNDTEIVHEQEVQLTAMPKAYTVNELGEFLSVDAPVSAAPGKFTSPLSLAMVAYSGFDICEVTLPAEFGFATRTLGLANSFDLSEAQGAGITVGRNDKDGFTTYFLTIPAAVLNRITADGDYYFEFNMTDFQRRNTRQSLKLALTEAPIEIEPVNPVTDVRTTYATLSGTILDNNATDLGIEYRAEGASTWNSVAANPTRATTFSVKITGLTPGTTYEYRPYGTVNGERKYGGIARFSTEAKFIIPNASFEEWGTSSLHVSNAVVPAASESSAFWDCGNHGSQTLGSSYIVTNKSTDMKHSGTYSARLETKKVVVALAAGNIYTGAYAGTSGTNGKLNLGRPFNGSHPKAVAVYANYRPGTVTKVDTSKGCPSDLVKGQPDHGQIYIALASDIVKVDTSSQETLFSPSNPAVLAYGQVTWTANFGPDGALERIEIPFDYYAAKAGVAPKYLIIVASASKYGDYFSGGEGSVLYLDDFELVYE